MYCTECSLLEQENLCIVFTANPHDAMETGKPNLNLPVATTLMGGGTSKLQNYKIYKYKYKYHIMYYTLSYIYILFQAPPTVIQLHIF